MDVPRLNPCLPVSLSDEMLSDIVTVAKDFAVMNGAAMRSKANFSEDAVQFAPFSLFPSSFPRKEFEKAVKIQPILNELMHKVAHDFEFLTDCLKSTIEVDEFTRRLFHIFETIQQEGISQQDCSLGLFRSDYLLHYPEGNVIKQVEFNTIASSFGGISTQLLSLNSFVLHELGHSEKIKNMPENKALHGLCSAMVEAWKIYQNPNDNYEVAVVYYRSGYDPVQYHSELEWDARLLIERSKAIKCPSIYYHLAGTKKVQQTLALPGIIEKFLPDSAKVTSIRNIFTGLYSLDLNAEGDANMQMALKNPDKFVLKPQREGGMNNVYGKDVRDKLLSMQDSKERTAWILMERITPPVQKSYIVRPGSNGLPQPCDAVSELGIFGAVIGNKDNILLNEQVGHMLRTKPSSADEGGVATGLGALDSPYLIDI